MGILERGVLAVQTRHGVVYEGVYSLLGRGLLRWLVLVALTSAWIVELQCSVEEHFLLGGEREIDFGYLPRYRNS